MIKKLFLMCCVVTLITCHQVRAQSGAIGFHITMSEYDGDLNGNKHHFYAFKDKQIGAALSFQQYLNSSFNLVEKISFNRVRYQNDLKTEGVDANFYTVNLKLK